MANKYVITKNLLSKEEALQLKEYVLGLLPHDDTSSVLGIREHVFHNRPDTWDQWGYIERGFHASDDHFRLTNRHGMMQSDRYFARAIDRGSIVPFVEHATGRDAEVHDVYRKIGILVLNEDYEGGETLFPNYGEAFKPEAGDLIMYEVDEENKTGISEITFGSRIEVVYWYSGLVLKTRFDEFDMPPMKNSSDRF